MLTVEDIDIESDEFDMEAEQEAIMDMMYPEGYDPDVDGVFDDDRMFEGEED